MVNKANIVVKATQESEGFEEMLAEGKECTMGQLYGEAVALKLPPITNCSNTSATCPI